MHKATPAWSPFSPLKPIRRALSRQNSDNSLDASNYGAKTSRAKTASGGSVEVTREGSWWGSRLASRAISRQNSQTVLKESQAEAAKSKDKAVKKGVTDEPHEGDFFL